MKTKEIDCYVQYAEDLEKEGHQTANITNSPQIGYAKAKLIIELPERKKEVTESEIRKAINEMDKFSDFYIAKSKFADVIIKSLFGESDE